MAIDGSKIILVLLTGILPLIPCFLISPQFEQGIVPFGHKLDDRKSRSLIECSLICSLTKGCNMVSYRHTTLQECALFQTSCNKGNVSQNSPNTFNHFLKYPWNQEVCPSSGQELYKATDRCKSDRPLFRSCFEALYANNLQPGYYNIQHHCDGHCNCIHCAMDNGQLVVSIGHDTEEEVFMSGGEGRGSVSRKLRYAADKDYILKLINTSQSCRQYASARCKHVFFVTRDGYAWMTGRNDRRLSYWAGGDPRIGGCACGINNKCYDRNYKCNCDANVNKLLVDDGYLTERKDLPITAGYFGDTAGNLEHVYFKAGQLECRTYSDNILT